ncbi:exopolysaccharide biosynthesis protein [Arthrobacter oryzae]|uniref:phosphodiester glycosidase family protein n=1 Tax=Arthrobacter TaxID=1663 RepID=UPI001F4732F0|nr:MULTISPECIES: phosphodiester glycosidase family protein [Arthrobacter]MDP9988291.1 exopolysaccharide biosynthesis protein [Arthrobacter oryzae]UKA71946.1 phosphodiester glycosidase family protein [Arthrobacter sp. FW306-06-A]
MSSETTGRVLTRYASRHSRTAITALAVSLPFVFLAPAGASTSAAPATPAPDQQTVAASPPNHLDLGAQDLPETRTVTDLAPGLTKTSISRGAPNQGFFWTAEVAVPSVSPDPDAPASALSSQAQARIVADKLNAVGITARVEHVQSPQLADAGGDLGYRVRAGQFPVKADGSPTVDRIKAAGYKSSVIYTGWDGDAGSSEDDRGPWNLQVLTIDPKEFRGDLTSTFGPNLEERETTSSLAAAAGALAATNGGYFVMDPQAGAPGDPAGVAVHDGKILSEPVADRPSLVIDKNSTSIQRLHWHGSVTVPGQAGELPLDGINRVPGLIRNCGGTDDTPTNLPLHDFTCTDADEIVSFTPEFGPATPSGPGLEVLLDAHGTVTSVNHIRGTAVPSGGQTLQAIGADADKLAALAVPGSKLKVGTDLLDEGGKTLKTGSTTDVVNGGPTLVQNGRLNVTARRDGMVRTNDSNSFFYGWVHKRNPRTFAGTDAHGRTLIVTADGRQTTSLGLSIKESADVARSLGMVNAMNLDGGGSTTMVQDGRVVSSPSDATGERPVGDALVVLPGRKP